MRWSKSLGAGAGRGLTRFLPCLAHRLRFTRDATPCGRASDATLRKSLKWVYPNLGIACHDLQPSTCDPAEHQSFCKLAGRTRRESGLPENFTRASPHSTTSSMENVPLTSVHT